MSKRARRNKAFRRRLDAIYRKFHPRFKAGDLLIAKSHRGPAIEIIDIVGDQYKYEIDGEELPFYEFVTYIDLLYEEI